MNALAAEVRDVVLAASAACGGQRLIEAEAEAVDLVLESARRLGADHGGAILGEITLVDGPDRPFEDVVLWAAAEPSHTVRIRTAAGVVTDEALRRLPLEVRPSVGDGSVPRAVWTHNAQPNPGN